MTIPRGYETALPVSSQFPLTVPDGQLENLRRSPPQGRKTLQGHYHRGSQKAGQHRERAMQDPSEMGRPGPLTDTVARVCIQDRSQYYLFQSLRRGERSVSHP